MPADLKYRRVLLKVSGEALMGERDYGLDPLMIERIAGEIQSVHDLGVELCLVIGGGNIFRGLSGEAVGMERASGDYMGMLATVINALAMHVAAANPLYIDTAAVPAAALDRERAVLREQAQASAKTEAIVERMVEGRLRKFYEEVVLLEQIFVIDGERRVGKVIEAAAKEAGAPIRVAGFVYFKLGEGVERPPSDFAAEVGAQLKN